jgi:acetolactate synthase-1/2/3 large subunit
MLAEQGVRAVFSLPGYHIGDLCDACYDEPSLRFVTTRHEEGCGFMALGYAQASGGIGVCMVIPGPGVLNASAALASAHACNQPVLCLSGQIDSPWIDRGLGLLHEVPRQQEALADITRYRGRIDDPARTPDILRAAFHAMQSGRRGPALVELPPDLAGRPLTCPALPVEVAPAPLPDAALLDRAADLLASARRPLIVAGGGSLGAWIALERFLGKLPAPVMPSGNGRGVIADDHPYALPLFAGKDHWMAADVVLAVGSRLSWPLTRWEQPPGQRLIRIDIDPRQMDIPAPPTLALHGDAGSILAALAARLSARSSPRIFRQPSHQATLPAQAALPPSLQEARDAMRRRFGRVQPQTDYMAVLDDCLPDDAQIALDSTQVAYFALYALPLHPHRCLLTTGYQGTLGSALPAAIGARIARPDRKTVAIAGDGGFLMTVQELATAVAENVDVIVIVFNDNAYGEVLRSQRERYAGRIIGARLRNPDFVRLARSFGARAKRVDSPAGLARVLKATLSRENDGPTIIEVTVPPMVSLSDAFTDG